MYFLFGYFEMTRKTPMSDEQLEFFLAKAKGDTHLQEKLKTAKSAEEVVCLAKEYGCEFTSEKISQLSKEELEEYCGPVQYISLQSYIWVCFVLVSTT